jgi:hypothetical protein
MFVRIAVLVVLLTANTAVAEEFAPFLARFRASVARQDKTAVAGMAQFPLRSYEIASLVAKAKKSKEPLVAEVSRSAFIKYFRGLFTIEARRHVATGTATRREEFPGEVRSLMIHKTKAGYSWLDFAQDEAGTWRLVGTDNVSN